MFYFGHCSLIFYQRSPIWQACKANTNSYGLLKDKPVPLFTKYLQRNDERKRDRKYMLSISYSGSSFSSRSLPLKRKRKAQRKADWVI